MADVGGASQIGHVGVGDGDYEFAKCAFIIAVAVADGEPHLFCVADVVAVEIGRDVRRQQSCVGVEVYLSVAAVVRAVERTEKLLGNHLVAGRI